MSARPSRRADRLVAARAVRHRSAVADPLSGPMLCRPTVSRSSLRGSSLGGPAMCGVRLSGSALGGSALGRVRLSRSTLGRTHRAPGWNAGDERRGPAYPPRSDGAPWRGPRESGRPRPRPPRRMGSGRTDRSGSNPAMTSCGIGCAQHALDLTEELQLIDADQRDGMARRAGTPRPADAMDVVLGHHRQLEVDDVRAGRRCRGRARRSRWRRGSAFGRS